MDPFPSLPCHPCPHRAACCAYGTTLSDEEARGLRARYGDGVAYRTRYGEWRTRVRGGRCVFYDGQGCRIHEDPLYPAVCRHFPWTDAETGGPYQFDQTICPEFVRRPELVQLGKACLAAARGDRGRGGGDRDPANGGLVPEDAARSGRDPRETRAAPATGPGIACRSAQ